MILWYLDRFRLPPSYASTLNRLLSHNGIRPTTVQFSNLNTRLKGSLLATYGSRSAPTWRPDREKEILETLEKDIIKMKPKAVVLSAPETLCRVGLPPEHCTLLKLRGSVYNVDAIPHIVILPMSAYYTQVNPKDVGGANYGIEDFADFELSQTTTLVNSKEEVGEATKESEAPSYVEADSEEEEAEATVTGRLTDKYDSFWYEPVLVPVGKFAIEHDIAKLGRIVNEL